VGTSLLPVVAQITDVSEWTDAQQSFYWISQNIIIWLPMFAVSIAGIGFAIAFVNRKVVGQPREAIQWLPPFNVIRHLTAANYLTTLSSLILAGESFKGALGKIRTNSTSNYLNYYVSSALARTRTGAVTRGPGAVIGDKLFTPWVMVKLEVFGDGDLESFTDRMAAISDEARENALNSVGGLTKLLNISMLIMAGFTVGFAVVTMYSIIGEVSSGGF
jgi:type II secretory pathway component PulF